jgi:hypothetical protein
MLASELEFEVSTWESIYHLLSLARRVRKTIFKLDLRARARIKSGLERELVEQFVKELFGDEI